MIFHDFSNSPTHITGDVFFFGGGLSPLCFMATRERANNTHRALKSLNHDQELRAEKHGLASFSAGVPQIPTISAILRDCERSLRSTL